MKKIILVLLVTVASLSLSNAQSRVKVLTDSQFGDLLSSSDDEERLLEGNVPIVIDFSATWCGPCQRFAPIYDATSMSYDTNEVHFYKVDIDKCPELKELFEIESIPTLVFIPVSGTPAIIEGAPSSKEEVMRAIDEFLLDK